MFNRGTELDVPFHSYGEHFITQVKENGSENHPHQAHAAAAAGARAATQAEKGKVPAATAAAAADPAARQKITTGNIMRMEQALGEPRLARRRRKKRRRRRRWRSRRGSRRGR
ncbi:uncharacterized protein BDZ99DRAFT_479690 [Mytilinidion resinicola]|uniref:Uncharacterized protein n=1 Tax=Mytilinidion resinicola TaxID=574789 RepID=A0A6A6YEZ9_9PEZI|nr:uncharacterized protein BDZ99DRAFT_479690 [Mytilinidion resinicola]KAF2806437.1 hypothetical protein BDZ99DRAFT_479690 [Mytilinidion resinicola]